MKDLTHKMAQFFSGEDFAENGEDARLELTPAELRQISNLMTENARLKTKLDKHNKAFDNIKDALNKWNPDTKISILSVWSVLDRNLDEFVADLNDNNKENEQMSVIDGKVITGLKMSDGEPVTGFVIGTAPFTYILPEDEVRKACCTGEQQVKIEITAERILAHD